MNVLRVRFPEEIHKEDYEELRKAQHKRLKEISDQKEIIEGTINHAMSVGESSVVLQLSDLFLELWLQLVEKGYNVKRTCPQEFMISW